MHDNGKIRVGHRAGFPYVDIYHEGEIQLYDVIWINQALRTLNQLHSNDKMLPLFLPEAVIIDGTGSYSLSENAYLYLGEMMRDCKNIAFVTHSYQQEVITDLIKSNYYMGHCVARFSAVTEAIAWLNTLRAQSHAACAMGG